MESIRILGTEDRRKRRPQACFGSIEPYIGQVRRATVAQVEAFGMRELMRQTGERGQPGIGVDPVPRQGVRAEQYGVLRLAATGPRGILSRF